MPKSAKKVEKKIEKKIVKAAQKVLPKKVAKKVAKAATPHLTSPPKVKKAKQFNDEIRQPLGPPATYVTGLGAYHMAKKGVPRKGGKTRMLGHPKIKGRGGFWKDLGEVGGAVVGSMFDAPELGSFLGGKLGGWVEGRGGYRWRQAPPGGGPAGPMSSNFNCTTEDIPMFGEESNLLIRVEKICDIFSSETFNVQTFSINPGLDETFPWGSQIAKNYLQYKPLGTIFAYKEDSTSFISTSNPSLGKVWMAINYDESAPAYSNTEQMAQAYQQESGVYTESFLVGVEDREKNNQALKDYFVRSGATSDGDNRFYDYGTLNIAVDGCSTTGDKVGELWVSYKFLLLKPKLNTEIATAAGFYHASGVATGVATNTAQGAFGYGANAVGFGSPTIGQNSGLPVRYLNVGNIDFSNFQPGNYLLNYQASLSGCNNTHFFGDTLNINPVYVGANQVCSVGAGSGITLVKIYQGNSTGYVPSTFHDDSTEVSYNSTALVNCVINVPDNIETVGGTLQINYDITNAGSTSNVVWDVVIAAIPTQISVSEQITEKELITFLKDKYSDELREKFAPKDDHFDVHAGEVGHRLKAHNADTYNFDNVRDDQHVKDTYLQYQQLQEQIALLKQQTALLQKANVRNQKQRIIIADTPSDSDEDCKVSSSSVDFTKNAKTLQSTMKKINGPLTEAANDYSKYAPVEMRSTYKSTDGISPPVTVTTDLTQSTTDLIKDVTTAVLAAKSNSQKK